MKKGRILNRFSAWFLCIGYGLNIVAIMRRDCIDARKASIKAAHSIMDTCYARILDNERNA